MIGDFLQSVARIGLGAYWLYYLAVFASLAVAVNGPGSLALERLLPVPRWLRE